MDFSTAHPAPVAVKIDGTAYRVPRFRMPHFREWAALRAQETLDAALQFYPEPEQRARFLLYWSEPLFDVAALADDLRTPKGVEYVLRTCLGEANVAGETIDALIDNADAVALRALAGKLASTDKAADQMKAASGDGGKGSDPTSAASHTSGAALPTGDSPPPDSAKPSGSTPKAA